MADNDFIIRVGSNISEVMRELEKAVNVARSLQTAITSIENASSRAAAKVNMAPGASRYPGAYPVDKSGRFAGVPTTPMAGAPADLSRIRNSVKAASDAINMQSAAVQAAQIRAANQAAQAEKKLIEIDARKNAQLELMREREAQRTRRVQETLSAKKVRDIEAIQRKEDAQMMRASRGRNRFFGDAGTLHQLAEQRAMQEIKQNERISAAGQRAGAMSGRFFAGSGGVALRDRSGRMLTNSAVQSETASQEMRLANKPSFSRVTPDGGGDSPVIETAFRKALVWGAVTSAIFGAIGAAQSFLGIMVQMDKQVADLRKTVSGTDQDFKKLVDSSIQIARSYKVGTQDVLDAIELFSKQFKAPEDLKALAESAALFSNISGQTIQKSAETLTATIQQYNLTAGEARKITDSWANVASSSAVTISDLGDAVSVVGQVAETAGVNFDQLNGMIAAVSASTGKSGTEIGNAMKRIFERTFAPENAKVIEKAGIPLLSKNQTTGNLENRNFSNILTDVSRRWKDMTDTQRKNLAVAFAGARQYDSFIALMTNWNEVLRLTSSSQNSFGAAQSQNEKISDTFAKKIQSLRTEFDSMARNLGQTVIPVLSNLLIIVIKLLQALNKIPGALELVSGIGAIGAGAVAGKFLHNQFGKNGGIVANVLSPFVAHGPLGPKGGSEFSLATGARNAGAFLGKGVTSGGSLGLGGLTGSLAGSVAAIVAAFAALGAIITSVTHLFKEMGDQTKRFVEEGFGKFSSAQQQAARSRRASERLGSLANELVADGGSSSTRMNIGNVLAELAATNPDVEKLMLERGMAFGPDNELVTTSNEAGKQAESVRELAEAIKQLGVAKESAAAIHLVTGELQNVRQGLFSGGDRDTIRTIAESASRQFSKISKTFEAGGIGPLGADDLLTDELFNVGRIEDTGTRRKALASFLGKSGFAAGPGKSFGSLDQAALAIDLQGLNGLSGSAIDSRRESLKFALSLKKRFQDAGTSEGVATEQANKVISTLISTVFTGGEDGSVALKKLGRQFLSFLPTDPKIKEDPAFGAGKGKFKEFVKSPVNRIDLELQKSLSDTATNFANLGTEVSIAEGAVDAYRKAITDLGTAIDKAAGPEEEQEAFKRQEKLFDLKEKLKSQQKDLDASGAAATAEQIFQEENIIQAIQEQNEERRKGLEILKAQYLNIQLIASTSKILQSAFAGAITSAPGMNRDRKLGIDQLRADRDFAGARLAQVISRGQDTAQQRNAAKAIREEIQQIDRSMEDLIEKTSIWGNLLSKIGEGILGEIANRISKFAFEKLAGFATEAFTGGLSLFGSANSTFNLLGGGISSGGSADLSALGGLGAGIAGIGGGLFSGDVGFSGANPSLGVVGDTFKKTGGKGGFGNKFTMSGALMSGLLGAGLGSVVTSGLGKRGNLGAIGGGIGGIAGSFFGPLGGLIGGGIGSLLGFLDEDIKPLTRSLDELEESNDNLISELQTLEKGLNTINDTMENIINAPANFVLPIPKGILENSVTAQSAIATPLQAQGLIIRSGPAFLHAGERVVKDGAMNNGGNSVTNQITIMGANKDPQQIADEVMNKLNSAYFQQSQRTGRYSSRF